MYCTLIQSKYPESSGQELRHYTQQKLLDKHRDYLLNIINNGEADQSTKELAVRCLAVFGVLRNSPEDYLAVYNLTRENNIQVSLFKELCLNQKFAALVTNVRETIKAQEEEKLQAALQPAQNSYHFCKDDADSAELTFEEEDSMGLIDTTR